MCFPLIGGAAPAAAAAAASAVEAEAIGKLAVDRSRGCGRETFANDGVGGAAEAAAVEAAETELELCGAFTCACDSVSVYTCSPSSPMLSVAVSSNTKASSTSDQDNNNRM